MSDKKIKQNNNINKFKKNNTGFTIIELLIVLGISIILATAAAPLYGSLQVSAQLNENSSLIIQSLRTARERSIAGYNNIQHGVFFDINTGAVDSYTLYQGSSYVARQTAYDRFITLDEPLSFSSNGFIMIGEDVDINFSTGIGRPNNAGIIILSHQVSGNRSIEVNYAGKIEEN
ncbi:MAG: hypothetical protein A2725_04230 [Candidatus Magasanikbacteria bacterium RIFCSPHIGHO2_01_FULL_33_34]|uniref:General secretion pathway GspH domain-containing protein n=1 Tax=Candidatus Magasanikbacteria bacterium RIFCSPHIGHO2_01_FULL_33_34 TaxID=1798671 RepID=A0A1F6LHV7_9BACT|nr:MAG: hypothetical protein A2725_04230 [Candidatus Magasanikbacteria bacterium RIFCSPHIGHO2_01_FULL_33_34]OGH65173.1 MAG: hypothetical protein A3B83_03990 [Candidatus Magasanikbacteria bacterium RIFCSPHIGHO2_02_FULL_33_17]OGH75282.1 MAG: hypothetical protein A3A89_04175 [Candidatus Magasanikbacteria bacterium RIFCSPLOWO2_01_FULL_33_34]OGH81037.1 MAG: hypothetical protein A3F93_00205 [Candidatus Magasanikbacteria bacterium RIFCSPLOWO2_12_FULL_34_7]